MKKITLLILFTLFSLSGLCAKGSQLKFEEANSIYASGDYMKAAQIYSSLITPEQISSEVYYNLGNCYMKLDELALAILNYNRALLLDPSNEDIRYNLNIATTKTTNRIEKLPEFFISEFFVGFSQILSSDGWACLGVFMLVLCLTSVFFFFFSRKPWIRKSSFSFSIFAIVLMIFAFSFSANQKSAILSSTTAIVMIDAVAVKSSPSDGGTDLFILNEGAKVEVSGSLGQWSEVTVESGNSGWLESSTIEYIKP